MIKAMVNYRRELTSLVADERELNRMYLEMRTGSGWGLVPTDESKKRYYELMKKVYGEN